MFNSKFLASAALCLSIASFGTISHAADGPTDMQIAHIAYTAGNIDIRYAHMAMAKSTNPEILEFARLMLQDHAAVNTQALALLQKLGASPEDNPTSQTLLKGSDQKIAELSGLSGADFDRAYATNELGYHEFVNKTLADSFIPAADNAEFKKLLKSALKVFKIHEGHARQMVRSL